MVYNIVIGANSSGGGGGDSELFIHGFCVSGSHKGHDWGQIHSCIAPQGGGNYR